MLPAFAELLGMHVGDGTLYRTSSGIVWELRGNLDEKEFYETRVVELLRDLGVLVVPKTRSGGKHGCYGVRCCRKEFTGLLLEAGMPVGSKTLTARVPDSILDADTPAKAAFLRGLFATDGTAYLSRINGNALPTHPKLEFASASRTLRNQTVDLLREFGFEPRIWTCKGRRGGPTHHLRLCGWRNLQEFHRQVGLSNPKHARRVGLEIVKL